jgi:hypothetical protein
MKRLDVKKLAAIGAGAALIGLALAPMAAALTKDQVLKGDKTPFDVVVGKNAATSDYLWAGNIAAKLAQLATDDTEVSCSILGWKEGKGPTTTGTASACKGLSVDLTVGGTTTYSKDASKTYDTTALTSIAGTTPEFMAELTSSQLGTLYNETKNWRYKSNSYSQTIREYIGIKGDAKMDVIHPSVGDLVLQFENAGDFNYRVNYSKGLPIDNSATDFTDFQAGDTDNVVAVLFGKEYKLYEVETTRGATVTSVDKIKLVKATGEKVYDVGAEITDLAGAGAYDGQTVSVKVKSVWSTTEAEFVLVGADGTELDSVSTSAEGVYLNELFTDTESEYALDTQLYVKSVQFNAATGAGSVTIAKGADMIEIRDGYQYPYNATDTDTTNDYWTAAFTKSTSTSPDANVITDIVIKNNVKMWEYNDGTPIYAKDDALSAAGKAGSNEAIFLAGESVDAEGYGYAKVIFNGWKNDQSMTKVKIGSGYVDYTDAGSFDHHVPFYKKLSNNSQQGTFLLDESPGDGPQTFYYKTSTADVNFLIAATTDVVNGVLPMATDGNLWTDQGQWRPVTTAQTQVIDLNGVTFTCTTYGAGGAFDFNCMADGNFQIATAQFTSAATADYIGSGNVNKSWYYDANNKLTAAGRAVVPLTGTSLNSKVFNYAFVYNTTYGDLWLMLDGTTNFDLLYSKDIRLVGTDTGEDGVVDATYYIADDLELGGDSTDNTFYMATFDLDDNESSWWTHIYVETRTNEIPILPNNNLSWYQNDVNYVGAPVFTLRADTPASYVAKAYTDFGSLFDVSSAKYFEATIPQDAFKLNMTVTGESVSTTVEGGTSFCAEDTCDYPALQSGVEQKVDSTTYTIENITCEDCQSSACAGVAAEDVDVSANVKTVKELKNIGTQIVYTDDAAPNTGVVIVGGHLVNTLAANATFADGLTLADRLTAAGTNVVEATEDGDWVVAGFTATDTVTAAKEFIDQLDAVFG